MPSQRITLLQVGRTLEQLAINLYSTFVCGLATAFNNTLYREFGRLGLLIENDILIINVVAFVGLGYRIF